MKNKVNDIVVNELTSVLESQEAVNNMGTGESTDNDFLMIISDYGEELVLEVISSLDDENIELLIRAYGSDLQDNNLSSLSDKEIRKIRFIERFIIRNCIRKNRGRGSERLKGDDKQSPFGSVSDDIITDRLVKIPFTRLSREEEI